MRKKHGNKKKAASVNSTEKHLKNVSVLNSDDEDSHEKGVLSRNVDDGIDDVRAEKKKLVLSGRQRESTSEEETVYALSSEISDSESDDENRVLCMEQANDSMARFAAKNELDSDIDDYGNQDKLPDAKAWGRKRQDFYSTDFVDKDVGVLSEKDKEVARMEEEEARAIQERLAAEVDEDAFGLHHLQAPDAEIRNDTISSANKRKLNDVDFSKLPTKTLMKVVADESPELRSLLDDCKAKLKELKQEIVPILDLLHDARLPRQASAESYLRLRYNLLIAYTANICFYLSLKAKRVSIRNHPIVKRLSQFRKFISELDRSRSLLLPQIQRIIQKTQNGAKLILKNKLVMEPNQNSLEELIDFSPDEDSEMSDEEKQEENEDLQQLGETEEGDVSFVDPHSKSNKRLLNAAEKEIMALYDDDMFSITKNMKKHHTVAEDDVKETDSLEVADLNEAAIFGDTDSENDEPVFRSGLEKLNADRDANMSDNDGSEEQDERREARHETLEGEENHDDGGRRAITYQIAKNKGLTPHRAKYMRNPRVRHRMKFRKANIRRKGQVRAMRNEAQSRYGGETSGINARVIKSVRLH